ncbi:MAG TPA: AAA family ATPase [Mucilaginibacter sp.]|jgi:ATPases involved in chromosome partitioning
MIILTGGEKGGTGKTTLATNLALMRLQRDGDVLLVDADPQPNASSWCASRDFNKITPRILSVQKTGKDIRDDVRELSTKYRNIILDTGGRDSFELRAGLSVADVAIVPICPSQFDLWTLAKFNDLVCEIKVVNPNLRTYICLNQTPTNPAMKQADKAREFFERSEFEHIQLAKTQIPFRIVYQNVATKGKTVHEAKIDNKAENELDALYEEIING